jgi:hypothetical protein
MSIDVAVARGEPMKSKCRTRGATAVYVAIVLLVLMGMTALAIDIGYLALTRAQLQAAADAATLSGGTELLPGLGHDPIPPASVVTAGSAVAAQHGAYHPNGDQASTYIEQARDVRFGWAELNSTTGAWDRHWGEELPGVGGYNLIGATVRRDQSGSPNADVPLPLIFARVFGHDVSNLALDASAVIMPAKGFRIIPGSDVTSNVAPIAIREQLWRKFMTARAFYETWTSTHPYGSYPDPIDNVKYDADTETFYEVTEEDDTLEPLFGHYVEDNKGELEFVQDFYDNWSCGPCDSKAGEAPVTEAGDGELELDIFPRDEYTSGNFGTVDIGSAANETSVLERQLLYGPNEEDLSHYPNSEFSLDTTPTAEGDTGISAGIKDELDAIEGDCRAILLFSAVDDPGNNATFHLTGWVGIRIMDSQLTGALEFKNLSVQFCELTMIGGIPDYDDQIGPETTVFTPLILIE